MMDLEEQGLCIAFRSQRFFDIKFHSQEIFLLGEEQTLKVPFERIKIIKQSEEQLNIFIINSENLEYNLELMKITHFSPELLKEVTLLDKKKHFQSLSLISKESFDSHIRNSVLSHQDPQEFNFDQQSRRENSNELSLDSHSSFSQINVSVRSQRRDTIPNGLGNSMEFLPEPPDLKLRRKSAMQEFFSSIKKRTSFLTQRLFSSDGKSQKNKEDKTLRQKVKQSLVEILDLILSEVDRKYKKNIRIGEISGKDHFESSREAFLFKEEDLQGIQVSLKKPREH